MGRWGLALLICVFAAHSAWAEDAGLKSLSAKLAAIRTTHGANTMRDAGPELTPIKRDLREWVERELPALGQQGDPDQLAKRLNAILKAADLTCDGGDRRKSRCEEPIDPKSTITADDGRGYLGSLSLSFLESAHYLLLETDVGVRCGYDELAYVYEWRDDAWHLLLQTEQDRYDEKRYAPQNFLKVQTSPTGAAWNAPVPKPPLILTLGVSPACVSFWQALYTRLWRASPLDPTPKPMLDAADTLYIGDDQIADAQVSDDDLLIEFQGRDVDGDVLVRPHILHFLIHGELLERVAPVALEPRQFVDEWLTRPWSESAAWIDAAGVKSALRSWHEEFNKGDDVFGEFDEDGPRRCKGDATLWQVGFTQQAGPKNSELTGYFIVRWMAPYRFSLMDIRKEKSRDCDIADPMRDNVGTLFPLH